MDIAGYLLSILEVAAIIPVGFLCLLTFVKNLKAKSKLTLWLYTGVFIALAVAGGALKFQFDFNVNIIVLIISALMLLFLLFCVKGNKLKVLYLFMSLGTAVSSLRLYGYLLEASLDSSKNFLSVQSWGLLLRWSLEAVICVVFVLILPRVRWLMENGDITKIWRLMWLVPFTLAASNFIIIPHDFYFFEIGRTSQIYIIVSTVLFLMHLLFQFMLFYTAKTITEKAKLDAQAQMLRVQASQYENLQRHIEATAKLRHDFKHTVRTAAALAKSGDTEAMIKLLSDYGIEVEASGKRTIFTKNSALNALVCYYYETAQQQEILCDWSVNLPEKLEVEDIDLCTVVGNLLENAIHASVNEPEQNRYITFKADVEENGDIYIVTTNGFSGKVKKEHEKYLSTKKNGSGIGLQSVKSVVNRYKGYVSFYNDQSTFYADVMLKQSLQ